MIFYFKELVFTIFEMISLKWMKLLTIFSWLETELNLRQPEFTYIACGSFTKHRERIRKFKGMGELYL